MDRDQIVYDAMVEAAERGERAPTCEMLAALLDDGDGGPALATTVNIVHRLERRGLIRVQRFQRTREVQIVATGKRTAASRSRTPHWRQGMAEPTGN